MVKRLFFSLGTVAIMGGSPLLIAEEPIPVIDERLAKIDLLMDRAVETLQIPGMAVGIVWDGKVIFKKGYGVRKFGDSHPVTEDTLFAIGSCSKAFTTFALGQLVDEGKIGWDDSVIKHLPNFRLHDIHATHHLTIRDLVTHRSGLPRHDLAWYNSTFSRKEILNRLPYLKPTCDLREKFQYNNFMYAVAGLVVEKVSGKTWEEFVQERVFTPLGMKHSNFSVEISQQADDFSFPHTEKDGNVEMVAFRSLTNIGPAGSINSSLGDMLKWVEVQLSDGKDLICKNTLKQMHLVQMPVHSPLFEDAFGYGLGWFIGLHEGSYTVSHGGGIDGFISMVTLYPKEKIGVVVLTNSDAHGFFPMMAGCGIADMLLNKGDDTWLTKVEEKERQLKETLKKGEETVQVGFLHAPDAYIGEFEHPGYGVIKLDLQEGILFALYNGIRYNIRSIGHDYFRLGMASKEEMLDGSFVADKSGDITELKISFETELPPIVFKRKISEDLHAVDYLKQFVGVFENPFFSMEIEFKRNSLVLTIPGQSSCAMQPEKKNQFSIKEMPNSAIKFVPEPDGKVSELQLHTAGQVLSLKAKAAQ